MIVKCRYPVCNNARFNSFIIYYNEDKNEGFTQIELTDNNYDG